MYIVLFHGMFYGMTTPIPLEVRRRIVRAYETGRGTQVEIARMFGTTQQFVSKLIQQYRQTGSMEPGHGGGHPPVFSGQSLQALQNCVLRQPDLTLEEVRERIQVNGLVISEARFTEFMVRLKKILEEYNNQQKSQKYV